MIIFAFLLQEFPKPTLGPWGTMILTAMLLLMAFFTWRNKGWKEAAASARSNLDSAKETITNLRTDKEELVKKCAQLEIKTNIEPLENTIKSWINESRDRFTTAMEELADIHKNNSATLELLTTEIAAQRETSERSFAALAEAFTKHIEDDRMVHEDRQGQTARIVGIIDNLEKRTAAQAVVLGAIESGKVERHAVSQKARR